MRIMRLFIACWLFLFILGQAWAGVLTKAELAAKAINEGKEMDEPFKGANTILIHTTDSAAAAYGNVARALLAANFALGKTDKEFGIVSTVPRPGKTGVAVTVNAVITSEAGGSLVRLRGTGTWAVAEFVIRGAGQQISAVSYGGLQGSPKREEWNLMAQAAAAYKGGRVTYANQP